MKPTKIHFLAVLAAISITALLGAPSAVAGSTSLCDVDLGPGPETICPPGHFVENFHEVNLSGSKEKMKFGPFLVECDVLFQGQTALPLGNPQNGFGAFTYTNCSNGCTVIEVGGQAAFTQLKEGHEKAKVAFAFEVRLTCMFFNCRYIGGVVEGIRWGPLLSLEVNGELSIENQPLIPQNPGLCPQMGSLTLRTTPLTKLYVTR